MIAKGNVVVLGNLNGSVTAGASGNEDTVIAALEMAPTQLKIGDCVNQFTEKGKRLAKGPVTVSVENGELSVKSMKKNIFQRLKFN